MRGPTQWRGEEGRWERVPFVFGFYLAAGPRQLTCVSVIEFNLFRQCAIALWSDTRLCCYDDVFVIAAPFYASSIMWFCFFFLFFFQFSHAIARYILLS